MLLYVDYKILIKKGVQVNKNKEELEQRFKDVLDIQTNSFLPYMIFALFLSEVANDAVNAQEVYWGSE